MVDRGGHDVKTLTQTVRLPVVRRPLQVAQGAARGQDLAIHPAG